jgi:hypothetical protein
MVLVALTVLLAKACQRFLLKATAAPVMLVLLSRGVQWCSCTDRAARGGLSALLIEGYCCASDARPSVWRRAMVLVHCFVLLARWLVGASDRRLLLRQGCSSSCPEARNGARALIVLLAVAFRRF